MPRGAQGGNMHCLHINRQNACALGSVYHKEPALSATVVADKPQRVHYPKHIGSMEHGHHRRIGLLQCPDIL